MMNTEPRGPIGAVDWTRRLRVGVARLVAGGFTSAGPNSASLSSAGAEWREARLNVQQEPGLATRLLLMLHMR